jgi:hypothetical protein
MVTWPCRCRVTNLVWQRDSGVATIAQICDSRRQCRQREPAAQAVFSRQWRDPGGASMADADDVRRLALALPEVEEIDSDGFDFRVAGKGFIGSYPERGPGKPWLIRTDVAVLYVGDEAEKQALLLGEPGTFFTAPGYDGWQRWTPSAWRSS